MRQAVIYINSKQFNVFVPETATEMSVGLSGVQYLPPRTGMLFDLPYSMQVSVTTKEMLFNLDIAFVDNNFTIVEIARNVQPGNIVTSQNIVKYFIEVNAGEFDDINVGDIVFGYTPQQNNVIPQIVSVVGAALLGVMLSNMIFGDNVMFSDCADTLTMSIAEIGYLDKIDSAFTRAIERAKNAKYLH